MDLGENKVKKKILIDKPELEPTNAILEELKSFAHAINNNLPSKVSIEDGFSAMDVAYKIIEKLNEKQHKTTHENHAKTNSHNRSHMQIAKAPRVKG